MSVNEASWILEPKGDLRVLPAPYPAPLQDEIVIKVCSNRSISIPPGPWGSNRQF